MFPTFPITDLLPDIQQALQQHPRLVLEAPPGAGKTTQVPLALLNENWCANKKILMLEPRRVAARSAAHFMSEQLGEKAGNTVGYRIRFENRVSNNTRIEVVTEGILTRMIQDDPLLENVGAILFDEFHERHLSGDLGLALALDVQAGLREDLRIVVMSATLDGDRLADFLDAQRLSSEGRAFPVETQYFPANRNETLLPQAKRCLQSAIAQHPGDVLLFLPGRREIEELKGMLQQSDIADCEALTLYGEMPMEQQSAALNPSAEAKRRIVLATNIAESSVTLPGVRIVIDAGLAREPRFDPNSGFSRLKTVPISLASADQRRGRAGRVAEGICFRLWPKEQRLDPDRTAEIHNTDLAALALELAAWGSSELRFVDVPPPGTFAAAKDLLQQLDALDAQYNITDLGRRMLTLGTHPRLATMLLSANDETNQSLACDLAALIDARDPLINDRSDDWYRRWQALTAHRNKQPTPGTSRNALRSIEQAANQWRRRLQCKTISKNASAHQLGDILFHAFPDRIARAHTQHPLRYQLSNGRMARLAEDSALIGEPWLAVSDLRFDNRDSLILRAAPLDETLLRETWPNRFINEEVVRWDDQQGALCALQESRFDKIVLNSKPGGHIDPAQAAAALTDAVADRGLDSLPWSEPLMQWRIRINNLKQWMPELNLPDLGDEALLATRNQWLLHLYHGKRRLDSLSSKDLEDALKTLLHWPQQQQVDKEAPTRIKVPSGLERPITYTLDAPPVLAVKLQELFGLAETPRIAANRIPLTLHLLSPGGKPLQITTDLHSFWENTYPEVKKEMKGRYPKHPWPDDPWCAVATHRAKPRNQ